MGRGALIALAVPALLALAVPAPAQQQERVVPSPVLTVDQDALFERSAFGRRVLAEIEAASQALAAENRALEAELAEEERRLTELRATTAPAEFAAMAAAFDERVVSVRRTQDQRERDLLRRPEEARQQFLRAAVPVLAQIVRDRGAVAILDTRAVILSADLIDITDEAIRRIDATLGTGEEAPGGPAADPADAPPADPAPEPEAAPAPEAEAVPEQDPEAAPPGQP